MKIYWILCEVHGKSDPWASVADKVWLDRDAAIQCFKEQVQQAKESFAKENNISWEEEGWEIDESDILFDAYHDLCNIWMTLSLLEREVAESSEKESEDDPAEHPAIKCCRNCKKHWKCALLSEKIEGTSFGEGFAIESTFVCDDFHNRWIEYPITVTGIEHKSFMGRSSYLKGAVGGFVRIRPCGEEYENKTYLGLYLGELPIHTHCTHNSETGKLVVSVRHNPAIYVFALKKIIYGVESFWETIDDPAQIKEMTDQDIAAVPYVKVLREALVC